MKRFLRTFLTLFLMLQFVLASYAWSRPIFDPIKKIEARRLVGKAIAAYEREAVASQARYLREYEKLQKSGTKAAGAFTILSTDMNFDADESLPEIYTTTELTIQSNQDGLSIVEFQIQVLDDLGTSLLYTQSSYGIAVELPTVLNNNDQAVLVFKNNGDPQCGPDLFFGMEFCKVSPEIVFFTGADFIPTKVAYQYEDLYSSGPISLHISVPADYIAASTSSPTGAIDDLGDRWVYHFTTSYDSTFFGLAYAPFEVFVAQTVKGKDVKAYHHLGTQDYVQGWADTGADIIDFYESVFSDYVYGKHDMIQTVDELGGGVGPQTATFYYASAFNTPPDQFTAESIFSHEIGHQWWGNMIRMGQSDAPWLNEGFAEYSSRLYGYTWWSQYYQDYLFEMYFRYFQWMVGPENDTPMTGNGIFSADSLTYQAVTYWKGAHFLRMLEWLLGKEDFQAAMHAYAEGYSFENSDELVTVSRFQSAMEQAGGMNLQQVFSNWVYNAGYPVYKYDAEFEGNSARVRVEQIQKTDVIYTLPVAVQIWVGQEEEPREFRMEFDGKIADAQFDLGDKPRGLRLDDRCFIWGEKVPGLRGDVDGSNDVNGLDLIYTAWSQGGESMSYENWNYISEADFNHDGVIDSDDLDVVDENFGKKGSVKND